MTQTTLMNKKYLLKTRPEGKVDKSTFELVNEPVTALQDGEFLLKNLYLSIDPTNRIWVSDQEQYMPPVQIGEVMRGLGLGRVVESKNSSFPVGHLVTGLVGWQEYMHCTGNEGWPYALIDKDSPLSPEIIVGAAGMTGLTAYVGVMKILHPKEGETVVISGAAGAVGSIAGQLAKLEGARVVGIAGSDEKCQWIKAELGFDEAVNYKHSDWKEKLAAATPNGIDGNFENVGGEIMQAVFSRLNLHSRVALCGLISSYNDSNDEKTRISLSPVLMKRVLIQGFIVSDYADKFGRFTNKLAGWIAEGKIKSKETIVEGLESAPEALNQLFEGGNTGKLLVKISAP